MVPWEVLIALATKIFRDADPRGKRSITVTRLLRRKALPPKVAAGAMGFPVSAEAKARGFDTAPEKAAIEAGMAPNKLEELNAASMADLEASLKKVKPRVLHYVPFSPVIKKGDGEAGGKAAQLEQVARIVGANRPELVAFSSCFTGRRLAPLAVANGAELALGFQNEVVDSSCPMFFGAFYREWQRTGKVLKALPGAFAAHNRILPPEKPRRHCFVVCTQFAPEHRLE